MTSPMRVHVLVDLEWSPFAGGHVKCWERLAGVAAKRDDIDLTLHMAGDPLESRALGPRTRVMLHAPVFSTRKIPFLGHVPDHTDMASYHPKLAAAMARADVVHTTDGFFAYAQTAEKFAASHNLPLVTSVHTDTVAYTELFTRSMLEKRLGPLGIFINEAFRVPEGAADGMRKKLAQHMEKARAVLVSRDSDGALAAREKVSAYRLGVDFDTFNAGAAARLDMEVRYNVPANALLVVFVGRLDEGKNFYTLVDAVHALRERGKNIFLLACGKGPGAKYMEEKLGASGAAPGVLVPDELAKIYASADVLALPSAVETWSMAAAEALACGLPVLAARDSGTGRFIEAEKAGQLVDENTAAGWADALSHFKPRKAMRERAVASARAQFPSWDEALEKDFMPIWRKVLK